MAGTDWGPRPVGGGVTLLEAITNLGLIALAVGVGTVIVVAHPQRTAGATRSARLGWNQRHQEIDSVMTLEQLAERADHAPSDGRP
jgi:hypothetical protein